MILEYTFLIQLKDNVSCKNCFRESLAQFKKQTTHEVVDNQFEIRMRLGGEKKSDTNETLRSLQPREEEKNCKCIGQHVDRIHYQHNLFEFAFVFHGITIFNIRNFQLSNYNWIKMHIPNGNDLR